MSIAIFSKQRSIEINYASESVWLSKDGLMEIVIDLLITNKEEKDIKELNCIVPQRIFIIKGERVPLRYRNKNLFGDITEDMISKKSVYNNPTDKPNTYKVDKGELEIQLKLANPNDPSDDIVYPGNYAGDNIMEPDSDFDDLQHAILTKLKLSIFTIKMSKPLLFKKSRWFRWKFLTLSGSLEIRNSSHYLIDSLLNKLYFNYAINGPGSIMNYPERMLKTYLKSANIYLEEKNMVDNDIPAKVSDVYSKLVTKGINDYNTKVFINDWRIRFYIQQLEPFSSIQAEGDVVAAGAQPNIIPEIFVKYYEWKTGRLNNRDSGNFTIRFLTKYESRIFKFLPYIALLLSIFSLILSFIVSDIF